MAGQPEAAPFGPCCSCTLYWTRDAFLKFSQSYDIVGLTAGLGLIEHDWTFWSYYRNGKAAVAVLARFTGMFLSLRFMSLCKSVCFIRGRGQRPPRVCVASYGQCDATCVCLSACFLGLNPMTVPQLSLNKFRASLDYRGLVLGLNVCNFFRSLGIFNGARANSTNAELEVADILTSQKIAGGSVGPSWTPVSVPAC